MVTGDIVQNGRVVGRLSSKQLARLRAALKKAGFLCATVAGKAFKLVLIASVLETLVNEGAKAAVDEAAAGMAWPLPVSQVAKPPDAEFLAGARNMGRALAGCQ